MDRDDRSSPHRCHAPVRARVTRAELVLPRHDLHAAGMRGRRGGEGPRWPLRLAASVLEGLTIVRAFILFHDFLHGAILRGSNVGARRCSRSSASTVMTPARVWRETHNYHHAHTAKIVGSNVGSYAMVTTDMWRRMSAARPLPYRLVRHPLTILFAYFTVFFLGMGAEPVPRAPRKHAVAGVAVAAPRPRVGGAAIWLGLFVPFLFAFALPLFIACALGAYLFYAQHNFPDMHVQPRESWTYARAALESSSYMEMGPVMRFFTGNIGYHHVHHLNPTIPFYRLPEAMAAIPAAPVARGAPRSHRRSHSLPAVEALGSGARHHGQLRGSGSDGDGLAVTRGVGCVARLGWPPLAGRAERAVGSGRCATYDSVGGIEGVDDPAVARVEADVAWPPQDVAHAHFRQGHLGDSRGDLSRGSRDAHAHRAPRATDQPRAVEACGPKSAPTITMTYLRPRERHDGFAAKGRGGLASGVRARNQRFLRERSRARSAAGEGGEGREGERDRDDSHGAHRRLVRPAR